MSRRHGSTCWARRSKKAAAAAPVAKPAPAEPRRFRSRPSLPSRAGGQGAGLFWRRVGVALRRPQPVVGAMLDPLLEFRLFDDPHEIVGIIGGDLRVALAAVFSKVKARVERRLGRPLHKLAPARALDQFFENRSGDDDVESGAVRRDLAALKARKRRGTSERVTQLLVAVALEVGP